MPIAVYTSSDEKFCFAEQTTWGTAVGDAVASTGILTEGFGIDSQINFRNPPRARQQRYQHSSDTIADEKGIVYQTNGMSVPAVHELLDHFLYGLFQNCVESTLTAGVHRKTFTFGQTQPDFSANAGQFYTLWGVTPVASKHQKLSDAIVSELTLTCAPGSNEGILWAAPTFIGRTHSDTANYTGTTTFPNTGAAEEYNFYDLITVTIAGTELCVLGDNGISITLRNGAKKVGQASGKPQTFALPRYEMEISMHILWDATARIAMVNARAGTATALKLTWGVAASVGHLDIAANMKFNQALNIEHAIEGDFVTLQASCVGVYGSTNPIEIAMTTNSDRGW